MTLLYPIAAIRNIEHAASATLPSGTLMRRAGQAAAAFALQQKSANDMPHILVLSGPGDNGGDALEAACHLAQAGCPVSVLCAAPAPRSADAQCARQRAQSSTVRFIDQTALALTPWSLVIDGLFGIGLARPIQGDLRRLVEGINTLRCPILALDAPSGLDADSGNIVGPDGVAIRATQTLTFIADKPGLHTGYGRDYAGQVTVATLDIAPVHFMASSIQLNEVDLFAHALQRRPHYSHKGSYGDVIVMGGASGMSGAPILAARTAAKCGAGRVFAAFLENPPAYDSLQPELMCRLAQDMDFSTATLVAGPGLGKSRDAHDLLKRALDIQTPLVLDADALNLIALEPVLQQKLVQRNDPALITPHPLEAARLLGISGAEVQANRLSAARELAQRFNAITILKGSGTIIAHPNGALVINPTGNPALATAGSGDVLAGLCGSLLAQHWSTWEAALAAVWLHGHAADTLVEQDIGPIGLVASELTPVIRTALNDLVKKHALKI